MALVAVTVNVDELPDVLEVGLAVTLTVGGGVPGLPGMLFAHPVNSRGSERQDNSATGEMSREKNQGKRIFVTVLSFFNHMRNDGPTSCTENE